MATLLNRCGSRCFPSQGANWGTPWVEANGCESTAREGHPGDTPGLWGLLWSCGRVGKPRHRVAQQRLKGFNGLMPLCITEWPCSGSCHSPPGHGEGCHPGTAARGLRRWRAPQRFRSEGWETGLSLRARVLIAACPNRRCEVCFDSAPSEQLKPRAQQMPLCTRRLRGCAASLLSWDEGHGSASFFLLLSPWAASSERLTHHFVPGFNDL